MSSSTPHLATGDVDQPSVARILPLPSSARPFPWSPAEAESRGVFGFDSRDIRSRPFNLLRRRMIKLARSNGWRQFGVVSAMPKVGKSFISSNLAAAWSRTPGVDVYLADLDLRRSSIAQTFNIEEGPGLQQFLAGELDSLQSVAVRPDEEKLTIIPSFKKASHSSELLSGKPMELMMRAVKQLPEQSIFICDLPPVFANDDAAIVVSKLDAYILIIEEGQTTKQQIKDSINILSPAVCAGTVLNRYHGGMISDDYGYGYGHSGKYAEYYG